MHGSKQPTASILTILKGTDGNGRLEISEAGSHIIMVILSEVEFRVNETLPKTLKEPSSGKGTGFSFDALSVAQNVDGPWKFGLEYVRIPALNIWLLSTTPPPLCRRVKSMVVVQAKIRVNSGYYLTGNAQSS